MEVRKNRGKWEPAISSLNGRVEVKSLTLSLNQWFGGGSFARESEMFSRNNGAIMGVKGCFLFAVFTWCNAIARGSRRTFLKIKKKNNYVFFIFPILIHESRTLVCVGTGSVYCFMVNLISMDSTWYTTFASTLITNY